MHFICKYIYVLEKIFESKKQNQTQSKNNSKSEPELNKYPNGLKNFLFT